MGNLFKKLTVILMALMIVLTFCACAAVDATVTAQKIHSIYVLDLEDLANGVQNYGQETAVTFSSPGLHDYNEFYSVKFCMTEGKPNVEVVLSRSESYGKHITTERKYVFFNSYMQQFDRNASGGYDAVGDANVPGNSVDENPTPLRNFTSQIIRQAISREFFDTDLVQNLSATKKGGIITVSADVAEDKLTEANYAFYDAEAGDFGYSAYSGSLKLETFTAMHIEYKVKREQITEKTITFSGRGAFSDDGVLSMVDYNVILHSTYSYNVKLAKPFDIK